VHVPVARVQDAGEKDPALSLVHETEPVGVEVVAGEVSVTVAVHSVVPGSCTDVGEQETVVEVDRFDTSTSKTDDDVENSVLPP
jgi:hypothetical protein